MNRSLSAWVCTTKLMLSLQLPTTVWPICFRLVNWHQCRKASSPPSQLQDTPLLLVFVSHWIILSLNSGSLLLLNKWMYDLMQELVLTKALQPKWVFLGLYPLIKGKGKERYYVDQQVKVFEPGSSSGFNTVEQKCVKDLINAIMMRFFQTITQSTTGSGKSWPSGLGMTEIPFI